MKIFHISLIKLLVGLLALLMPISLLAQKYVLSGSVSDEYGPLYGAIIEIAQTDAKSSTDISGGFSFNLEAGTYELKIQSLGFAELNRKITLNQDTVLHVLLRSAKVEIGGQGEPVDVISQEEIRNSSRQNLGELLQYLVPTFHSTHQTISDGTDHIDPISLRGLGPDQVLILINGKRYHTSSLINVNGTIGRGAVSTDLNAIPVSMIDHVEILKNGASTLYGSDAVAGVINIVLRKESRLAEAGIQVGTTKELDGTYTKVHSNVGFQLGQKGFIHVSGEVIKRDPVNRSGAYTSKVFGDDRDNDLSDFFFPYRI